MATADNAIVRLKVASRAATWHLLGSAATAALVAAFVFGIWFPYPYRHIAGGVHLFFLIVGVDLVCGPLLTLVVFNPKKPRRELVRDLAVIVLIQLAALAYGVYSLAAARPLAMVYETDRFVVVSAAQIDPADLVQARPEYRSFPLFARPVVVGTREPANGAETLRSLELSLAGKEPSHRLDWWIPYPESLDQVKRRMKPLVELMAHRTSAEQQRIMVALRSAGVSAESAYYLPLTTPRALDDWVVILSNDGVPIGFAEVSGF